MGKMWESIFSTSQSLLSRHPTLSLSLWASDPLSLHYPGARSSKLGTPSTNESHGHAQVAKVLTSECLLLLCARLSLAFNRAGYIVFPSVEPLWSMVVKSVMKLGGSGYCDLGKWHKGKAVVTEGKRDLARSWASLRNDKWLM